MPTPRPELRWKISEILKAEGLTAYRLEQILEPYLGTATVYRLVKKPRRQINIHTLMWVIWGLRQLTGKEFTTQDVLWYEEH